MNHRVSVAEIPAALVRGIDGLPGPGRRDGPTEVAVRRAPERGTMKRYKVLGERPHGAHPRGHLLSLAAGAGGPP